MAIICAVGDGLADSDPTFVGELLYAIGGVPIRMVSQAAARRNITFVIARGGSADAAPARARSILRRGSRVAACGQRARDAHPADRSRPDGTARRGPGAVVRLRDGGHRRRAAAACDERLPRRTRTSRSISRWPTPLPTTCRSSPRRRSNVVDRHDRLAGRERRAARDRRARGHRRARVGEFLARHACLPATSSRCGGAVRGDAERRRVDSRVASFGEEGRAVWHRAAAHGRDGAMRATRGRSTSRPRAPDRCPARTSSVSTARRRRSR